MKYRDILITVLSEVTGKPKDHWSEALDGTHPEAAKCLDKEVPDEESIVLIDNLLAESSGILAWLVKGCLEAQRYVQSSGRLKEPHN